MPFPAGDEAGSSFRVLSNSQELIRSASGPIKMSYCRHKRRIPAAATDETGVLRASPPSTCSNHRMLSPSPRKRLCTRDPGTRGISRCACWRAAASDLQLSLRNETRVSRLLQLPESLLLLVFRFFSADELPEIAAAASKLWRMLLKGDLLQRESSARLHSGRRWLAERSPAAVATENSSSRSSSSSVILQQLSSHPGRLRRLYISSRVLEPVPPTALLAALREQCSSLEHLHIASADGCSQGNPSTPEAFPCKAAEGCSLGSAVAPSSPQHPKGIPARAGEVEEAGGTASLQEEAVETAASLLVGVTFSRLRQLRVQGCQAFFWLRLLSHCSFPSCREVTIACACIRQHTVPLPHGAAAAGADLLSLIAAMPGMQRLQLEMALPPTRGFWRELLFPPQPQAQRQQRRLQHLRISESIFPNLAEVLEEAKLHGVHAAAAERTKHHFSVREICVVAAHRRLHPATMLRSLAAAECADPSAPSYSISTELLEANPMFAGSRTMLRLLQGARQVRLILGDSQQPAEEDQRVLLPRAAAEVGVDVAAAAGRWQEAVAAELASAAFAAAATAAEVCRQAAAASSIELVIRDDSLLGVPEPQSAHWGKRVHFQCKETHRLQFDHQKSLQQPHTVAATADHRADAMPLSLRLVALPAFVKSCCCLLSGKQPTSNDLYSSRGPSTCIFCGCPNGSRRKAAEQTKGAMSSRSSSKHSIENTTQVCVCFFLQLRVLPLLSLMPSFLLGHSGGGNSPWGADTTAALLQSDALLLRKICSSSLLRPRCIGLEAEAAGQTPQQRRSFSRFLRAAVTLPPCLRPPLRVLRVSLISDSVGPFCVSGVVKVDKRALSLLGVVLQQYAQLQQVEVAAPLYLRDPAEQPTAAREPLPLLQIRHLLKQHGFDLIRCISNSAFRHKFVFNRAAMRQAA